MDIKNLKIRKNPSQKINSKFKNFEISKFKNKINKYPKFKYINAPCKNHFKNKKYQYKNKINKHSKINKNDDYNYNYWIHSFLSTTEDDDDDDDNSEEPKIEDIPEYLRDLAIVFSKKEADKLPPHRLTDCKIVLEKGKRCYSTLWSYLSTFRI